MEEDSSGQRRMEVPGEEAASDFNEHKEAHEKEKKDERKRREEGTQSAALDWKCEEPECEFVRQRKAGLVNHVR